MRPSALTAAFRIRQKLFTIYAGMTIVIVVESDMKFHPFDRHLNHQTTKNKPLILRFRKTAETTTANCPHQTNTICVIPNCAARFPRAKSGRLTPLPYKTRRQWSALVSTSGNGCFLSGLCRVPKEEIYSLILYTGINRFSSRV